MVLNGMSYSGADIKAIVHIYDGGTAAKNAISERIKRLRQDLNDIQTQLETIRTSIQDASLTPALAAFNSGRISHLNSTKSILLGNEADIHQEINRLELERPQISTKVLGEIQTLSVSTYREKVAVRALGHTYPKSYTRGGRTIAGSMIFAVMYQNVLEELLQSHPADFDMGTVTTALVDQLPPFDITIAFANEYGAVSRMAVMGVEFVNDGQTMSIEDMFLENVMQYVARDIDPMRQVGIHKKDLANNLSRDFTQTGSALLLEEDYQQWKDKLNPFGRFNARNNRYI